MAVRYYLIRRNLETFLGPMTVEELRESYKRMAFGLQDEISGHCGPWAFLSDTEVIKEYYPEIQKIIQEDSFGGWAISEHTAKRIPSDEKTNRISTKRGGLGLAFMFLAVALGAAVLAIYVSKSAKLSGKLSGDGDLNQDKLSLALQQGSYDSFVKMTAENEDQTVARALRSKKDFDDWIPYLRAYAFLTEGSVNGLSQKLLRGNNLGETAPIDCSVGSWRKRWQQSVGSWGPFFAGKKVPTPQWARMIAWDPYWIKRRVHFGWLKPQSFYEGCLIMANKALADVPSPTINYPGGPPNQSNNQNQSNAQANLTENRILQNRIDWLLDTIAGRTKKAPLTVEGVSAKNVDYLSFLTCLEEAPSMDILRVCQSRFSLNGADPVWMATVERAILWNSLRITQRYSTGSKIDPQTLNDLITSVNKPDRPISQLRIDQFTRFDYGAELKFLKALSSSGGDVPKATDLIRQEFSDVVFDR